MKTVERIIGNKPGIIVREHNGQALAYVYFEEEPGPTRGFGHSI